MCDIGKSQSIWTDSKMETARSPVGALGLTRRHHRVQQREQDGGVRGEHDLTLRPSAQPQKPVQAFPFSIS
jgi:hypothetical protein